MKTQLVKLLIVKSILDTALVATVAVVVYLHAFPPTFHGWGEAVVQERSIAGWAVNDAEPWQRVEVQIFVDGRLVGTQLAQLSRPDVVAAGWTRDEWHGYRYVVNNLAAGMHEARVYAVHSSAAGARYTLQMLGDPIQFEVSEDGTWKTFHTKAQSQATKAQRKSEFLCVFVIFLCAFV
ncbi:MAG TPA: hypothetical protein VHS05_30910 [Pyrinomonadaceae bacterium]|jgi:hypothetical protein|nr:hypothetical protein [Pyrinomonadaceae bacterium]